MEIAYAKEAGKEIIYYTEKGWIKHGK
jgi:hypothetical protein